MTRSKSSIAFAAAGLLIAAGLAVLVFPQEPHRKDDLGLFSSLPIYWPEGTSITETFEGASEPHWVRTALERDYRLVPLDILEVPGLGEIDRLIIAQPRPLSPSENVALDDWVRRGGSLLLFADPFLTEHSRFGLGDPRRPNGTVLLSPILGRWGLALAFDEDQLGEERIVDWEGTSLPVHLAGTLAVKPTNAPGRCTVSAEGVIAACRIGKGRALVVADAALLEPDREAHNDGRLLAAVERAAFPR